MASSKTITLISSDGETFDLEEVAARELQVIKPIIEDGNNECAIPLPNVTNKILAKVIEYCKKHVETPKAEEHAVNDELKGWAADFFKDDRAAFFDLIKAADYLRIESLLDLACQTVVDMTKEMSPAEICEIYVSIKEKSLEKISERYNIKTGLTLKSSDIKTFDLDVAVATKSQKIKRMIKDRHANNAVLDLNVTSKILAMVIEYCKKHAIDDKLEDFVKVDRTTLLDLINAANYLHIKSLLDLTCQTLSDMTQEMSGNEICEIYLLIKERSLQKICKIYDIETKLTLQSSDGEFFYVDVAVAMESQTIKHMIEDGCADHAIPVPKVTSPILAKVIEYCKKHVETPKAEEHAVNDELRAWDADFVKVDQATLFDLILAAYYLDIKSLLDLTCQTLSDMTQEMSGNEIYEIYLLIKERSLQKICKIYNIETKLTLQSSDGEFFYVDVAVAMESQTIKHMIEDGFADHAIPVPNVTSQILARVIEYCKKHVETPRAKEHAVNDELKAWDADFVKVDRDTVLDLVLAADYLEITSLLDLTCRTVADMIQGRTPAEIEKMFKFQNDFTPEEEEEVRRENAWAFERDDEWVFE